MRTEVIIPETWKPKSLGNLCSLLNGFAFKPRDWSSTGTPIIRIQNLNGGMDFNYYKGPIPTDYEIEPGTLLFAWSGNRGTSFGPFIWKGPKGLLNQHIFKVFPDNGVNPDWFYFALDDVRQRVERDAHGAIGLVHVRRGELESYLVLTPEEAEQKAIARVLQNLDDVIQQTAVGIEKLKKIKAGLLHDLLTRGIDEKGQLRDPATHAFIPSPIGLVPTEWNVRTLDGLTDPQAPICYGIVQVGKSVKGGILTLAIRDIEGDYQSDIHRTSPLIEAKYTRSRVEPGDLLLSIKGTTGRIAIVPAGFRGNISRDLARIRLKAGIVPLFLKFYFQSPMGSRAFDLVTVGTTRKEISIAPLKKVLVPIPPEKEQDKIVRFMESQGIVLEAEKIHLSKLSKLKIGLMHELLTGRVRVPMKYYGSKP